MKKNMWIHVGCVFSILLGIYELWIINPHMAMGVFLISNGFYISLDDKLGKG